MNGLTFEIRYHRELSWWDGRYRVYVKGRSGERLLGGAITHWGARKVISGVIAREKATQTYRVVEIVQQSAESAPLPEK
jgi:hypothetical protein